MPDHDAHVAGDINVQKAPEVNPLGACVTNAPKNVDSGDCGPELQTAMECAATMPDQSGHVVGDTDSQEAPECLSAALERHFRSVWTTFDAKSTFGLGTTHAEQGVATDVSGAAS